MSQGAAAQEAEREKFQQSQSALGQSGLEGLMNAPAERPTLTPSTENPPVPMANAVGTPGEIENPPQTNEIEKILGMQQAKQPAAAFSQGSTVRPPSEEEAYKAPSGLPITEYKPEMRTTVNAQGMPIQQKVDPFMGMPVPGQIPTQKYVPPRMIQGLTPEGGKYNQFVTPTPGAPIQTATPGAQAAQALAKAQATLPIQMELMKARGMAYGAGKFYPVISPETGQPSLVQGTQVQKWNIQGKTTTPAAYSPDIRELMAAAGQRGGATSANVNYARSTFNESIPIVQTLRQSIMERGILPEGKITSLNQLDQWFRKNISDPDVAALQARTSLMAESLSRVLGSTQGGEYMLKFAQTLLNPALGPDAFNAVLDSHKDFLEQAYTARRNFGKTTTPAAPVTPGATPAKGGGFTPAF